MAAKLTIIGQAAVAERSHVDSGEPWNQDQQDAD